MRSILLCWLMAMLCGCCVSSKEDVQRYGEDLFGEAQYLRTEKAEGQVIYYFQDKEYEFEYYVISRAGGAVIDETNFEEAYYRYVLTRVQEDLTALEEEYQVTILDGFDPEVSSDYRFQIAEIYCASGDYVTPSGVAKAVHDLFVEYDTREHWENRYLTVYNDQEEKLGIYSFAYHQWLTPQAERDVEFLERIQALHWEAEFVRIEEKAFRDTGLTPEQVDIMAWEEPPAEDKLVTYYYFTVEGKEYFLADIRISTEDGVEWYTNYKRKKP